MAQSSQNPSSSPQKSNTQLVKDKEFATRGRNYFKIPGCEEETKRILDCEYLVHREVSMIAGGNARNINKAPQASTPSNSSTKSAERKNKKESPRKASTDSRKKRKISSNKTEGCASSSRVVKDTTSSTSGKTQKPKTKLNKSNKKEVSTEAIPTYQPREFIGLFVCKDNNGTKTLGVVNSYDATTKLFEIWYDDEKTDWIEKNEVLKSKATRKDIFEARQQLQSSTLKETSDKEKEKDTFAEQE